MIGGTNGNQRQAVSTRPAFARSESAGSERVQAVVCALLFCLLLCLPAEVSAAVSTEAEKAEEWAQQRICEGKVADFNAHLNSVADPRQPEGWDERRLLSPAFLIRMISGGPCAIPPHRIDIIGAWFHEPIDLQGANIATQLQILRSRFDSQVHLQRVSAGKLLSFAGSRFGSALLMTEIAVRGSLFLGQGASFEHAVSLWGASVDGLASFSTKEICTGQRSAEDWDRCDNDPKRTRFAGNLDLSGTRVARILDFRNVDAHGTVTLDRVRVDGELRLSGSQFGSILSMDSIRVGESVEAWGVVWGQRNPDGSCVSGLDSQEGNKRSEGQVSKQKAGQWLFYNASIGSSVYLTGACLADLATLNLAGTRIAGQLFLGSIDHFPPNAWGQRSILILRNTSIGKIQDVPSIHVTGVPGKDSGTLSPMQASGMPNRQSWPLRLELDGFTYASWDGLDRQERPIDATSRWIVPPRGEDWLITWLARDHSYSRQPYEQLARMMATQGRQDVSIDILFASREIERCIAIDGVTGNGIERCILRHSGITPSPPEAEAATPSGSDAVPVSEGSTSGLGSDSDRSDRLLDYGVRTTIWLLNGYGYRPVWALGWFFVLILIGTLLFRYRTEEGSSKSIWFAAEYTFDTLLPAVNLCKDFDDVNIKSAVRYYFVILKVLGYVFVATLLQFFYQIVGRSLT